MPFNFAAISKAMSSSAGKRSTSPRSPSPTPPSPAAFAVGFNPSAKQTGLTTPPVPFTNNRPFVTNTSPSPKKKSRTVTSIQVGSFVSYNAKVKKMKEGGKKCNFLVHTFDDSPSFPRIPIESTCTVNSPLEGDDINITCSQFDAFEKKALEHCSIKTSVGAPPPPTRSSSRLAAKKMSSSSALLYLTPTFPATTKNAPTTTSAFYALIVAAADENKRG
eukprot:CAMPEP_0203689458 /NCGR_PEP_ID=MMETSP0091-20130426/1876_1 /ASSEMBLY_ACC=CAM_ASM_001089 /TAXON_ID=426623 /ORGANISM="Chaetoceros affinis, Strain CCMP159" /LENGTH=218 /DNA_ID=CAMNT_0050559153 /DNA_START=149 /DNA_END=803 /DNA_ORIENTATION=+